MTKMTMVTYVDSGRHDARAGLWYWWYSITGGMEAWWL